MTDSHPTREEMERRMLQLLRDNDLPQPDEVLPHEDGGILLLWHERRLAVVVDPC